MTFAPHGIDDWLLGQFPAGHLGYAADVGATDGVTRSNTMLLETRRWTVLCIEPNPEFAIKLRKHRTFVVECACDAIANGPQPFKIHEQNEEAYSALKPKHHPVWHPDPNATWRTVTVKVATLNDCLERAAFPRLDALSVDVEGHELEVLKGLDLNRWKPHAMIVESWDDETPVTPYLAQFGYRRVDRRLVDNLYLRDA